MTPILRKPESVEIRMTQAITIINDLLDVMYENTNCPDCLVEAGRKHGRGCRFQKAIDFLGYEVTGD